MSRSRNLLFVLSDEHARHVCGFQGHPEVRTPTLDRLAARGTWFDAAYATSPICVPARASIATGRYLFEQGYWDNADAYDGASDSWHHVLRAAGHPVVAIGKLHFKGGDADTGFSDVRLPMHILGGKGDLLGLLRDQPRERSAAHHLALTAGPGESDYTRYDRAITDEAIRWIGSTGRRAGPPWALFVSFVAPHFPLIAPPEFYDRYAGLPLELPKLYEPAQRPDHPALRFYRETFTYDRFFSGPDHVRRALAAYYGLVSFMDDNLRRILLALEDAGLAGETDLLYSSDHGDNLGTRGLWGKSTMYEEAVGVPLLYAGNGYAARGRCGALASHVDLRPFILEHFGLPDDSARLQPAAVRRRSLARIGMPSASESAGEGAGDRSVDGAGARCVLAEYHATGSRSATYLLRSGTSKLIHHLDGPPQFFDLAEDPEELRDRGTEPACAPQRERLVRLLEGVLDPLAVDARAKARQAQLREAAGGTQAILEQADYGFSPVPAGVLL